MLVDRMIRAARLESSLYDEVEADTNATSEALIVVVLASVAAGIGNALGQIVVGRGPGGFGAAFISGIIAGIVGWLVWSLITYWVGTALFRGTATYGELLRTIGYANSPRVLSILIFIPILGGLIGLVIAIWTLIAGVIAVRQALDFDTGKAVITVIIGWVISLIITFILFVIFGIGGLIF